MRIAQWRMSLINQKVVKLLYFGLFLVTTFLTGCIDVDVAIKLNKDGSGTVTETSLTKSDIDIGVEINGKKLPPTKAKPLDDFKVKMRIASYGGQVRLLSNEPSSSGDKVGYKAVFAFDDINQLRVPIDSNKGKDFYTFHHIKGKTTRLQILSTMDWLEESEKEPTTVEKKLTEAFASDPKAKELMNSIITGLQYAKWSIHLELPSQTIKSNALYQRGFFIDLVTMNFGQMGLSPDFEKLMTMQNVGKKPTEEEMMAMRIPGMRVDFQKDISIEYE